MRSVLSGVSCQCRRGFGRKAGLVDEHPTGKAKAGDGRLDASDICLVLYGLVASLGINAHIHVYAFVHAFFLKRCFGSGDNIPPGC